MFVKSLMNYLWTRRWHNLPLMPSFGTGWQRCQQPGTRYEVFCYFASNSSARVMVCRGIKTRVFSDILIKWQYHVRVSQMSWAVPVHMLWCIGYLLPQNCSECCWYITWQVRGNISRISVWYTSHINPKNSLRKCLGKAPLRAGPLKFGTWLDVPLGKVYHEVAMLVPKLFGIRQRHHFHPEKPAILCPSFNKETLGSDKTAAIAASTV